MRIPLIALLVLSVPVMARAADDWQRIVVIDNPRITVTLVLKKIATAADEEFVGFELDNRTAQPMQLSQTSYQLDDVRLSLRGGGPVLQMSLASGHEADLLWHDGIPAPGSWPDDDTIPPGITRRLRYCSAESVSHLGIAPVQGYAVDGRVHFDLSLEDGARLSTPDRGIPFHFDWVRPDARGIDAMRQRLKRLLAVPEDSFADTDLLETFLADGKIASAVTSEDLVMGLNRQDQGTRRPITEFIDREYPTDEHVIAFFLDVIKSRDGMLIRELADAAHIHDARLITPLLDWIRQDAQPYDASYFALKILSRHRDLMVDRAAVTSELGRIMLARSPLVAAGKFPKDRAWYWANQISELVDTGDVAMVTAIAPFLDDKDVVVDAQEVQVMNNGISTRACDVAYNAILDLQEQPGVRFSTEEPSTRVSIKAADLRPDARLETIVPSEVNFSQAVYAERDELIARLKASLRTNNAAQTQPTK